MLKIAWFLIILPYLYLIFHPNNPTTLPDDSRSLALGWSAAEMMLHFFGLYIFGAIISIPLAIKAQAKGFNKIIYWYYGLGFLFIGWVFLGTL